jgi:hypothetical protein
MAASAMRSVPKRGSLIVSATSADRCRKSMRKFILSAAVPLCLVLLPSAVGAQALPLPRVRITTGAIVELPGVIRLDGRTATGSVSVVENDEETVTVHGTALNAITLPRPRRKVVGVVESADSEALTLLRTNGSRVVVPRGAIAKVERTNGRRSRARAAGLGFLIGAGGGAGVGFLIGATCDPTAFMGCFLQPWGSTFAGVVLGGAVGALVGAVSPPKDRWMTVSVAWLNSVVSSDARPTSEAQVAYPPDLGTHGSSIQPEP